MSDKPKIGDTVWYEVGSSQEKAKIVAISGNTQATIQLLTGPQRGQELEAPWGIIKMMPPLSPPLQDIKERAEKRCADYGNCYKVQDPVVSLKIEDGKVLVLVYDNQQRGVWIEV